MVYDSSIDTAVNIALWSASALFAVTLLLVLAIVYLRAALILRQRKTRRLMLRWQPHLAMAVLDMPTQALALPKRDAVTFLALWNHAQESFRGVVKEQLNQLARLVGADRHAHRMMTARAVRKRLVAITALGHLRDRSAWDELVRVATVENPTLSLSALRALLSIDARAALPVLIPLLKTRDDWPTPRVATILREAGPDIISKPLAGAALRASAEQAPRLIRYLEGAHLAQVSGTLGYLMKHATDDSVISACLQVLPDPAHLDAVREYTRHARWHVRLHAARALGRLGGAQDIPRLIELLSDEQWWVRYRAAQALAAMPGVSTQRMEEIRAGLGDPFARDIMTHVMAERRSP